MKKGYSLPTREEIDRNKVWKMGMDYMQGKVSIADIQAYLYSWEVVNVGGFMEATHILRNACDFAVSGTVMFDTPIKESRRQPAQDEREVAAIYARKIRKPRYDFDKPYPKPFFSAKETPNPGSYDPIPWYGIQVKIKKG